MHKVLYKLAERFSQEPLETYFANNIFLSLCDFGYVNTFWNQIASKPIAAESVRNENINFDSDRTSSRSEKIQTKQSLQSSKVSSSHQTPSYQAKATSLNT